MSAALIILPALLLGVFCLILLFLLRRMNFFTVHSYGLYAVLGAVWIVNGFALESRLVEAPSWVLTTTLALASFIPGIIRVPLAWLTRRLRSRKIPLLLTNVVFLVLCVPFLINPSPATFIVLVIGYSFPGATFGASNSYLSENWTARHLYTTYALIIIPPVLGFLSARLVNGVVASLSGAEVVFDTLTLRWVLLVLVIILSFILLVYTVRFPLRTKVLVDNKSVVNRAVSDSHFGALIRVVAPGIFLSLLSGFFINPVLMGASEELDARFSLISMSVLASTLFAALGTSLFLVHHVPLRVIVLTGKAALIVALSLLTLFAFALPGQPFILTICLIIGAAAIGVLESTYFGYASHIGNKTRFLLIGSYLSLRSLAAGTSDVVVSTAVTPTSVSSAAPWVALSALLIAISILVFYLITKKWRHPIEEMIELYEQSFYKVTKQFLWKKYAGG